MLLQNIAVSVVAVYAAATDRRCALPLPLPLLQLLPLLPLQPKFSYSGGFLKL